MIEFYLDSVDIKQVSRLHACLPLKGVTTNPTILAKAKLGVNQVLPEIAFIIGSEARFHVQVVSQTVDDIVEEAIQIDALPYDMVVKIPATETGLAAIKIIKDKDIKVLATAIYSVQQGIIAALSGADYLAPYVNRMDTMGCDGVKVVADLQLLIAQQGLNCKLLPASFKNTLQVIEVMKLGVKAITIPIGIAIQMMEHPAVIPAVEQFNQDWNAVFGAKLSYES
ncbi:MAG: fructose-6-phosphate aldolase [Methylococcales bacterium]|nr:fructose-6-phosphate aldolase [Methylococcales bacterium]